MRLPTDPRAYLGPSRFIDSEHPSIRQLATTLVDPDAGDVANAITLYQRVRDGIRYNPYALDMSPDAFLASTTLAAGQGWCVPKGILLAALCRAAGIPARVGYADVRNHLSTERLRATMKTDVFYYHGYTSIYLNERWVKATPAFNIELCEKFGLKPLEFNGLEDSLYHAFDVAGNRHMEYISDRGEYPDLPYEDMLVVFKQHYGDMLANSIADGARWDADVEREVSQS